MAQFSVDTSKMNDKDHASDCTTCGETISHAGQKGHGKSHPIPANNGPFVNNSGVANPDYGNQPSRPASTG